MFGSCLIDNIHDHIILSLSWIRHHISEICILKHNCCRREKYFPENVFQNKHFTEKKHFTTYLPDLFWNYDTPASAFFLASLKDLAWFHIKIIKFWQLPHLTLLSYILDTTKFLFWSSNIVYISCNLCRLWNCAFMCHRQIDVPI